MEKGCLSRGLGMDSVDIALQAVDEMIINNNVQAIASFYAANSATGTKRTRAAEQAAPKDEVVLSNNAQSFRDMLKELHGMDGVRQQRVEELSRQIENGTYNVSSANIAASMLNVRF